MLYKAEKYLDPLLIQKHFSFNTLGDMLEYLFQTKGTYKNETRISLIKSGLRDLENKIKQMPKMEITDKRANLIVNLVEKILDVNENNWIDSILQKNNQEIKTLEDCLKMEKHQQMSLT